MGKTKIKTVDEEVKIEAIVEQAEVASEAAAPDVQDKKVKAKKPKRGQPKQRGKKYQVSKALVDSSKKYSLNEAITLSQKASYTKFPGTLELHINTSVKNIRGLVTLPYLSGKKLTILAFGKDADKSGADIVGDEGTIAEITKGKLKFDVVITTPDWMPKLAQAAKILGPRGLMPNPKNGTISDNLKKTVTELQGGKTEYKTEANGQVIHLGVGKANQPKEEIFDNIKALYNVLGRSKIRKITIAPTMGPGVRVDLSSI